MSIFKQELKQESAYEIRPKFSVLSSYPTSPLILYLFSYYLISKGHITECADLKTKLSKQNVTIYLCFYPLTRLMHIKNHQSCSCGVPVWVNIAHLALQVC